ncbi:hypothetical protein WJX72_008682 [[Myrmecia] bisecta]|uniref:NAD(P)H dehydrogenase (quinone) n=1 Tax=[Myrmecia] bisecta TaxID=41462 RepID=A0AAW1PL58_9CHLO
MAVGACTSNQTPDDCKPSANDRIAVVGIVGSLREESLTRKAVEQALKGAASTNCHVELIDLAQYDLYFCDGLDYQSANFKKHANSGVKQLREKLQGAKGIILGTPEYHNSFSGVLKNALDLTGFAEFEGKVVGLVAVSGGAMGGLQALQGLRDICRALHAWVVPAQAGVAKAWEAIDMPESQKRLQNVGKQVAIYASLLNNKRALEFIELLEKGVENPGGTSADHKDHI